MFSEAFDEEILGMKKGQTKEFTLEIPEDETAVLLAGQAGKPVTFEVTCNVVKKKVTPEVTTSGPRRRWASSPSRTCASASRSRWICRRAR